MQSNIHSSGQWYWYTKDDDESWFVDTSKDFKDPVILDTEPEVYDDVLVYYSDGITYLPRTKHELVNKTRYVNGFAETVHDIFCNRCPVFSFIIYSMDPTDGTYYIARTMKEDFKQLIDARTNKPIKYLDEIAYRTDNTTDGYLMVISDNKWYISNIYTLNRMYRIPKYITDDSFDSFKTMYTKYGPTGIQFDEEQQFEDLQDDEYIVDIIEP